MDEIPEWETEGVDDRYFLLEKGDFLPTSWRKLTEGIILYGKWIITSENWNLIDKKYHKRFKKLETTNTPTWYSHAYLAVKSITVNSKVKTPENFEEVFHNEWVEWKLEAFG